MVQSEQIEKPTEPGWYIGRMKTWSIHDGPAPVRVSYGPNAELVVCQCGDERPWPLDAWELIYRIWP